MSIILENVRELVRWPGWQQDLDCLAKQTCLLIDRTKWKQALRDLKNQGARFEGVADGSRIKVLVIVKSIRTRLEVKCQMYEEGYEKTAQEILSVLRCRHEERKWVKLKKNTSLKFDWSISETVKSRFQYKPPVKILALPFT